MSNALFQKRFARPLSVSALALATFFGVVACQTPPTEPVAEEATPAEVAVTPDSLTSIVRTEKREK